MSTATRTEPAAPSPERRHKSEEAQEREGSRRDQDGEGIRVAATAGRPVEDRPPPTGPAIWFYQDAETKHRNFITAVSLQLDHRLIDQREFLEAILSLQPGNLRRPLETETAVGSDLSASAPRPTPLPPPTQMDVEEPPFAAAPEAVEEVPRPQPVRRGRARRGVTSRFKGFDADLDADHNPTAEPLPSAPEVREDNMFVSQRQVSEEPQASARPTRVSQRKRPAAAIEEDIMEDLAPTAAALKRRRLAAGEDPFPPPAPEPVVEDEAASEITQRITAKNQKGKKKKVNENEILELARQRREEAEKRQAEEKERLNALPEDGIDYEEIRKLTIVEEFEVRRPAEPRTREQDIADGRWDPSWNGRRNFKKFRQQGQPAGRPAQKVIIALEAVKPRQYGIGDDYWLEDAGSQKKKKAGPSKQSQPSQQTESQARPESRGKGKAPAGKAPATRAARHTVAESDSDEAEENTVDAEPIQEPDLPRTRVGKAAEKATTRQSQTRNQTQSQARVPPSGKRAAVTTPPKSKPVKRARRAIELDDSDDSDDELRFRFGRR